MHDPRPNLVGPPPVPTLRAPLSLRRLSTDDRDVALVTEWMSRPHIRRTWGQDWPADRWRAELSGQLSGQHSCPLVARIDGADVAYLEIYRVARDTLADRYRHDPSDVGLHIAVAAETDTGRGLGPKILSAVADGVFTEDPACRRVVAEPAVVNRPSVRAFEKAGFVASGEIVFAHKIARLMVCTRGSDAPGPAPIVIDGIGGSR